MSRLDEIAGRLDASKSAASDQWEVGGPTDRGGYAVVATDAMDVSTDEYLPEESAELFAHAPADLAALVKFAREVETLHVPHVVICLNPTHSDCDARVCDVCDTAWPCPTAAALQQLGGAS